MPSVASLLVRIDATTEQLRRELASANSSLSTFANKTEQTAKKVDQSLANVGSDLGRNMDKQAGLIQGSLNKIGTGIRGIQGAFGALGVAMGGMELARGFVQMSDAATTMENRLKTVTSSAAELSHAQDMLYASSQANSVETSTSVELFTRLSRALQGTGADAERVSEMVDTLSKMVRLSGTTTAEASSALLQFSQALNKGKLNGDEFRSMGKNLPMLLQGIAEHVANLNGISLDQARAELQKMAEDGQLTTEIIVGATEEMRSRVVEDFGELASTAAGAATRMWNALTRLVGKIDDVTGISGGLVEKLNMVTGAFDFGIGALNRYGGALSGLLGWINAIPHPLSLLAQAAAGAAAGVAQAAGEIEAIMKNAAAARAELGAGFGLQPWQNKPGEAGQWQGNITRSGDAGLESMRNKLAGGLKVLEATGGRREVPVSTNPMDIAGLSGGNVDFTTFGVKPGNIVTGVTRDRPKLKFYKGQTAEEKKASQQDETAIENLKENVRTPQEDFQVKVAQYKTWLDSKKIDEETYSRAFGEAGKKMQDELMRNARERADPKAKEAKPRGGGGGKPKKSEALKDQEREEKQSQREGKEVFNETRTAAEAYRIEIERLDELLADKAITQEEYARAVKEVGISMQESQAAFAGGQEAASAYLDQVARLQEQLATGGISQDEYNARVLEAQQKYAASKSSAADYAAEVANLDKALAEGAISQEEHAASLQLAQTKMNESLQEGVRLWEETRTPLERYHEELRRISELWAAGVIGDDTKLRAAKQAWEELRDETEKTNASMKAAKALGDDLGMSFASAFEDAILEGGKLRDIMQGLWKDIQRIVVRQMVTVPLATGLSSIMTGFTGAMMGAGTGAAMPPMPGTPGGGFQHGGFVHGPGSGTSDSIPAIMPGGGLARLSNGEFIVNAKSAAKYERLLMAINNGAPGKAFAAGGPIGNLRAASAAPGTGSVQIILENKSSTPLKTEGGRQEGPGPDGKTMIRVMVVDAVKGAMASGEFDRTMGARYGAGVQPIAR